MFTDSELEELALFDLDDDFIEANVRHRTWDPEMARLAVQGVCDNYVNTFLRDDSVATLHGLLRDCDQSLVDIDQILQSFIVSLESTQNEIGDVRERLKHVALELSNARAAESALWGTLVCFVVPPEVVRVVTQSNDEELGQQFQLSVQQLLRLLHHRKEKTQRPAESVAGGNAISSASLADCRAYHEERDVLERLTVHACVKTKRFLSKKISLLGVKNTNVSIQQEHVLRPYSFFVHFLRSVPPLLRPEADGNCAGADLPYRITKALYEELRREYCALMSHLYAERIRYYVCTLNAMEKSTQMVQARLRSGNGAAATPMQVYVLPLLTEAREGMQLGVFALGERGALLDAVFNPPLVPTVERAKKRTHYYEETFRSLNSLLCDAVTHEFLFTFMFFSGDMSVFVDVFKPTIQFIVDYVSEVMLDHGDGSARRTLKEYPHTAVNVNCRNDCYGLLMLIRLCHEFRTLMKNTRRLSCLEGFYDSLLLLLWPAFKRTFERQVQAVRTADVAALLRAFSSTCETPEAAVARVHPLAKCYAVFVSVLVSISRGCSGNDREGDNEIHKHRNNNNNNNKDGNNSFVPGDAGPSAELRRAAWRAVELERESDVSDSASRFAVLAGNLSFLRVEIVRLLREVGARLARPADPARQPTLALAFLLNNLHHVLCAWRGEGPEGQEGCEEGQGEGGVDYNALEELEKTCSAELVESLVRRQFANVVRVIQCETAPAAEVMDAADTFTHSWRSGLDRICEEVRAVICDSAHEDKVLAHVCMEVLLYNTRFHGCVARALDETPEAERRPIRTLVVTNQQMLQHMRTLARMPEDEEDDSDL